MSVAVEPLSPVLGQTGYMVVDGGTYDLLGLVPCRRETESGPATCAFLAATVIGQDPTEVQE